MQLVNKTSAKKTFTHTWYLYPLAVILMSLLWIWGFQAFHQPSEHQKIDIFFATEVKNETFLNNILKQYDREQLREITPSYSLPNGTGFTTKLQLAINRGDLLILDENTLKGFDGHDENFYVEYSSFIKDNYLKGDEEFYSYEGKDYGLLLKKSNETHWLNQYMDFDESQNYYITLTVASVNLGKVTSEDNAKYDNALTMIKYLLTETK